MDNWDETWKELTCQELHGFQTKLNRHIKGGRWRIFFGGWSQEWLQRLSKLPCVPFQFSALQSFLTSTPTFAYDTLWGCEFNWYKLEAHRIKLWDCFCLSPVPVRHRVFGTRSVPRVLDPLPWCCLEAGSLLHSLDFSHLPCFSEAVATQLSKLGFTEHHILSDYRQ
jgi:hypothetical protein